MDSYSKETIFHLPGIFRYPQLYEILLKLYLNKKEYFKNNVKIGSIYDSPGGIWNGGRLITGNEKSLSELAAIKDMMLKYQIPIRFTFTNCLLEEEHLHDTYCNILLELFNTGINEIICNKEILENYIRNKYGNNYKYISSTTKRMTNKEKQKEEIEKDYYLIVLDYDHNKDFNFLQSIKNKHKCELLCNAVCKPNCPNRIKHYESISQSQLLYSTEQFVCQDSFKHFWEVKNKNSNFISIEDIENIYLPMGFTNFKLEGRTTHPLDLIEILLYYLVKEKYQPEVRDLLQISIW